MKKILKGLAIGFLGLTLCFNVQAESKHLQSIKLVKVQTKIFKLVINNKVESVTCTLVNGKWVIPQSIYKKYPNYTFTIDVNNSIIIATIKTTTTNQSKQPQQQGYGGVEGNITWQYNDYVGTKADVGASVVLIKKGLKASQMPKDFVDLFSIMGRTTENIYNKSIGLYSAVVDGTGHYKLDRIPVGDYIYIIVSKNTTRDLTQPVSNYIKFLLNPIFGDKSKLYEFGLKMYKSKIDTIKIEKDYMQTISFDFGNTYF